MQKVYTDTNSRIVTFTIPHKKLDILVLLD